MFKISRVFLIALLRLLHCVTCDKLDLDRETRLSYFSNNMGMCSDYMEYLRIDDFINGKLTLPNLKLGDTVKMTFQRYIDEYGQRFNGILLPDESSAEVISRIQNGQLITYRVDFPVSENVPELIQIFVNDNELCATKFNTSDEILVLEHKLEIINGSIPVFTNNIHIPKFTESPTCGFVDMDVTKNGVTPLTYSSSVISRGEFPWLTAIYKVHTTGTNFICGGSLVTSEFILTPAHCFQGINLNAENIIAILGRFNLTKYTEDNIVIREIETVILHPEYKYEKGFPDADLALLKMKNPVSFSQFIKPICLWSEAVDKLLDVKETAAVVGWADNKDGNNSSVVPKKVQMDIVSENECICSSAANITIIRTLCAENREGSEHFVGESGLILNRNGLWTLRGVTSAELNFCNLKKYTVYSDVAKHRPWLEKYIKQEVQPINGPINGICGISGKEYRNTHPWLVTIYKKVPTGVLFWTTGSLISHRSVLAHAHWFEGTISDYIRIYLGRYDLNNIHESGVVSRDVASLIYHPDFQQSESNFAPTSNDIVLLQMKEPVSFTQYVKPICLWSISAEQSNIVGQSGTLSSWDDLGVYDGSSTALTSIDVNVVSMQQCESRGFNVSTPSRFLCIPRLGNKRNKTEGILMLKRNGRWLLRGVSAMKYYYDTYASQSFWIYTDLAEYLSWIQSNMLS